MKKNMFPFKILFETVISPLKTYFVPERRFLHFCRKIMTPNLIHICFIFYFPVFSKTAPVSFCFQCIFVFHPKASFLFCLFYEIILFSFPRSWSKPRIYFSFGHFFY